MESEGLFPLVTDLILEPPKVAILDLSLELGDDVRIVTAADLKMKSGSSKSIGIPCWATVTDKLPYSKYKLLVSSFEPCNRPLRRGYCLIAHSEDIWFHHAPGSHVRFIEHVRVANALSRADHKPTDGLCELSLAPCYLHEYSLAKGFEDVRGCWYCGGKLPKGNVLLPSTKDEGPKPKLPKSGLAFKCGDCKRARYCRPLCADMDSFAHALLCTYWQ